MIKSLQAGRAIAALCVVFFHLTIMMGEARYGGEEVFRLFTRNGNLGVDFFFILSGFIIIHAHSKDFGRPEALRNYLFRRFVRLFPIYWVYTIGVCLLVLLIGGAGVKMPTSLLDWVTTLSLVRFSNAAPPLEVAWTLFHEVAFYAAFAVLIVNWKLGLFVFFTGAVVSLVFFQFPVDRNPLDVYTSAYNLYFIIGMGAYWLFRRGGSGVLELTLGSLIAIAVFAEIAVSQLYLPLLRAFAMAFILVGAAKIEAAGGLVIPNFLVKLGDASYTIYLTHLNFCGLVLKILKATHIQSTIGNSLTYVLAAIGGIGLGCIAYELVEKPMLKYFRSRVKNHHSTGHLKNG